MPPNTSMHNISEVDCNLVSERIRLVISNTPRGLHEPCFRGQEKQYLMECIDTGWVSSAGSFVERFEHELAEYTGAKYAIATVNGTAALHTCLMLIGIQPGDEVLLPALSFVATANAVSYCGAIPHFVDSSPLTLGIDSHKLGQHLKECAVWDSNKLINRMSGRPIKAVIPMHTFGHPVDMPPLVELCKLYNLALIEDAAESLGSFSHGKHTGTWGGLSALSFNGNKIITTGGGGAILTDDAELAVRAKHLTTTAKTPHPFNFYHDMVAYNYRLPNLNAALGVAQLEQLNTFLEQKRCLAKRYEEAFSGIRGIRFFTEPENARSNYWLNVLLLDETNADMRDDILEQTNRSGIMTRPCWTLLSRLPMYVNSPKASLMEAERIEKSLINIPSSSFLGSVS